MKLFSFLALTALGLLAAVSSRADDDIQVTGTTSGSVWGSGPYTDDSNLGAAAVHAGLIGVGQTATIRVIALGTQSSFHGSTSNGVTTSDWFSQWNAIELQLVGSPGGGGGNTPASVSHSAPSTVYVGESFTVTASCSDPDGNLSGMCVRWYLLGEQAYWPLSGSSATRSVTLTAPSSPGIIKIRAEAIDTLGEGADSGWQEIEVIEQPPVNHPPAVGLSFSANPVNSGANLRITASASDPDGNLNSMGVRWLDHDLRGWWAISGSSAVREHNEIMPSAPGTHSHYFRGEVWDNDNAGIAADWQAVVVVSPGNPSLAVLPIAPKQTDSITVTYAGAPDSTTRIALFQVGAGNYSDLASVTVGAGSGSVSFSLGASYAVGVAYEARMQPSDGSTSIANSNEFTIASANPTYSLTVYGGIGGGSGYATGAVRPIGATPQSGQAFNRWSMYGSGNGTIADIFSPSTTFTIGTTDGAVQALYDSPPAQYLLTVQGGNRTPAGPQPAGTVITLTATPGSGQSFVGWTQVSGPGSLSGASQSTAAFTLGSGDATVQATYTGGGDATPPSVPTGLTASNVTATSVTLSWTASTDANGVTGYELVRNGVPDGTLITGLTATVTNLQSGSAYQFQVRARNAAGNWSAWSTPPVNVSTIAVTPVRLALQYWYADDYPNYESGYYEDCWQDGHWNWSSYVDYTILYSGNYGYYSLYDPDGGYMGEWPGFIIFEFTWEEGYWYSQWVGETYPDGYYGSCWDTTTGSYNIGSSASGYTAANANRGSTIGIWNYQPSQTFTFRAHGLAPAGNCNTYSATIYAPDGTQVATGTFASNSYWHQQVSLGAIGVYRIDIRYLNATGGANPVNGTVSYYVPVGSLGTQTITFPVLADRLSNGAAFALGATASSGLPVFYEVVSGPATVSGGMLTLAGGTGTVTVRATQPGGSNGGTNWSVATPVTRTFVVAAPTDTQAPSRPTGLQAANITDSAFTLSWNASTDNVGVTGYRVQLDDGPTLYVGNVLTHTFGPPANNLAPGSSHTVHVQATDAANNWSDLANAAVAVGGGTNGGTGGNGAGQTFWMDTNGDSIPDKVIGSNSPNFTFYIDSWTTTNLTDVYIAPQINLSLTRWSYDFGGLALPDFGLVWVLEQQALRGSETYFNLIFDINVAPGTPLKIYADYSRIMTDIHRGRWALLDIDLSGGFPVAGWNSVMLRDISISLFENAQFFLVQESKPMAAARLDLPTGTGALTVDVNVATGKVTLPGGWSVNNNGMVTITSPGGTNTILTAGGQTLIGDVTINVNANGEAILTLPGGAWIKIDTDGRIDIQTPTGSSPVTARRVDPQGNEISAQGIGTLVTRPVGGSSGTAAPTSGATATIYGTVGGAQQQLGIRYGDTSTIWFTIYLMLPELPMPKLAVDANRDGQITFDSADATSAAVPYRFWINDDNDGTFNDESDQLGTSPPDYEPDAQGDLISRRDLEDFARLWIHTQGLNAAFRNGELKLGLRWAAGAIGVPELRIYRHCETDGGTDYLSDLTVATTQTGSPWNVALRGTGERLYVDASALFVIPTEALSTLSDSQLVFPLLFEGAGVGKGNLVPVLLDRNGNEIGSSSGVWMDLCSVKTMYERATVSPDTPYHPFFSSDQPVGDNSLTFAVDANDAFVRPPNEETKALVFVHGWNMSYDEYLSFSETMFKRLWWQGYKGRFCTFRWATLLLADLNSYNTSEFWAWRYGDALRDYLENPLTDQAPGLKARLPGYSVSIAAHSMGNIVAGSALKRGATVHRYFLMEAAVPAGCFSDSVNNYQRFFDAEVTDPTPDFVTDLGYRRYLESVSGNTGKMVNFFSQVDFALATGGYVFNWLETNWEDHQEDNKPDDPGGPGEYHFDPSQPIGHRSSLTYATGSRSVLDMYESLSYVARPRSKAIGAEPNSSVVIADSVDLATQFGFGLGRPDHSGQFTRQIQQIGGFFKKINDELK